MRGLIAVTIAPVAAGWLRRAPLLQHRIAQLALARVRVRRELWRQVNGGKVRAAYPKYTTKLVTTTDFKPAQLRVKFLDGRELTMEATGRSVADLYEALRDVSAELEEKEDLAELDKA